MEELHLKLNNEIFVPKEGQRDFECSNKESFRCPSLGIKEENEDLLLEELAQILLDVYISKKKYENSNRNQEINCDLCQSIEP